jgi:hypothetical protein
VGDDLLTGRYDIRGLLERDETGEQWLAVDLAMRRPVVIWLSQPGPGTRLPDGMPAHGRLPAVAPVVHPSVLRTYDAGRAADGRDYLVREFVEGTDIAALLARHPRRRPAPAPELDTRLATPPEQTLVLAVPDPKTDPSGVDTVTDAPLVRRRTPVMARARRLTGAGSVVSAVIVVAAGAMLFGAAGEEQAQGTPASIDVRPSRPVRASTQPSSPPHPRTSSTQRPSRNEPTPRPTAAPTTPPVTHSSPASDQAARLHSLAVLLHADRRAAHNQRVQSAATLLDQAAAAVTGSSPATDLVRAAFGQLADAERSDSWHPSGSESTLLRALGYSSPMTTQRHGRHDN